MGKGNDNVKGVVRGTKGSHYYPLIPIAVPPGGADGYYFPNAKGGFGVMQNFLENPEILETRSPLDWGDARHLVYKNWVQNGKWLEPDCPMPKPRNAKELFGCIKDPERVAVIACCGPNLTKNFTYLYEARRLGMKVDVFTVNRAPKAIRPDGHMVIERRGEKEWYEDRLGSPGFVITLHNTATEVIQHYLDKEVPVYWGRSCIASDKEIDDARERMYPPLSAKGGTTVSCLLYTLCKMGYRKIAIIGSGLAIETMPKDNGTLDIGRMYFDRSFKKTNYVLRRGWSERDKEDRYVHLQPAVGTNGEPILIHRDFVQYAGYIQCMAAFMEDYAGVEVCNCTEGGFLWLPRQMPLREYLDMDEIDEQRQLYNAVWAIDKYGTDSPGSMYEKNALALAENFKIKSVLDYGCGDGQLCIGIARNMPDVAVLGLDVSDVALAIATEAAERQQLGNVQFGLSWEKKSWKKQVGEGAMIVCFDVLEHLKDEAEVKSMLKKLAKYKPRIIVGTACAGHAYFRNPYNKKNLHSCQLRPMEWQELLQGVADKMGVMVTFDMTGRVTTFTFVFGEMPCV